MSRVQELAEYFRKFPGIGPRQAKRIVVYLLHQDQSFIKDFLEKIKETSASVKKCSSCNKYFDFNNQESECDICRNPNRNNQEIIVVGNDNDLETIEKTHVYSGKYYVIGSYFSLNLDDQIIKNILEKALRIIGSKKDLKEIIFALSATPDGDFTTYKVKSFLEEKLKDRNIKITKLARGLSTGTEIEYSDTNTIKSAFENRD